MTAVRAPTAGEAAAVQALRSGDAAARLRALRDIKNQVIGAQNIRRGPLSPRICSHLPLRRCLAPRLARPSATPLPPRRQRRGPARRRAALQAC
jgi:hypothetical protein